MKIFSTMLCIFSFLIIPTLSYSAQTIYYVTPTGSGSQNGTKNDPWSLSDFNNKANWSSVDDLNKIDPGDTVNFKGTFNTTTKIEVRGSGKHGNVITLDGTNAIKESNKNYWGGGLLQIVSKDYLKIQNFRFDGNYTTGEANQAAIKITGTDADAATHII